MRILLVEDDRTLAKFILRGLREENYAADHADNGRDGLQLALGESWDAVIVDIMLPGLDGLSLIQEMRKRQVRTPVIILSARRSVDDRVRGLQTGGDDYLTKPFAISELLARLQALIRRSSGMVEPTSLSVGPLHIDLLSRVVERDGVVIDLQPKEYALLAYLARNAGRVVTKTMIIENVWNYNFDPETNVVEARISKLRDKVDEPFQSPLIHTIRGAGYVVKVAD